MAPCRWLPGCPCVLLGLVIHLTLYTDYGTIFLPAHFQANTKETYNGNGRVTFVQHYCPSLTFVTALTTWTFGIPEKCIGDGNAFWCEHPLHCSTLYTTYYTLWFSYARALGGLDRQILNELAKAEHVARSNLARHATETHTQKIQFKTGRSLLPPCQLWSCSLYDACWCISAALIGEAVL